MRMGMMKRDGVSP